MRNSIRSIASESGVWYFSGIVLAASNCFCEVSLCDLAAGFAAGLVFTAIFSPEKVLVQN
jgi:hypothetical protein